jgi:hypothetical protein
VQQQKKPRAPKVKVHGLCGKPFDVHSIVKTANGPKWACPPMTDRG